MPNMSKSAFIISSWMLYLQLMHRVRHIVVAVQERNTASDANHAATKRTELKKQIKIKHLYV